MNNLPNRVLVLVVIVLSMSLIGLASPAAAQTSDDTSAPTIDNFEFSSESYEPGDTIEIDVTVTDETDIKKIYFNLEHGGSSTVDINLNKRFDVPVESGTYTVRKRLPTRLPSGTYQIDYISTEDSLGNSDNHEEKFGLEKRQISIGSSEHPEKDKSEKRPDTIKEYTNDAGYVDSKGLLNAGADYRNGEIDEDRLSEIASAFRSGKPLS